MSFVIAPQRLVIEGTIEETEVIMRSLILVAVFTTVEVFNFLRECFTKSSYEFRDVRGSEAVVRRDIVSLFVLFVVALGWIAVRESNETIAMLIGPHAGLVDDPDCPHESMIQATTKTRTASNFKLLRRTAFMTLPSTGNFILIAFQRCVARHVTDDIRRAVLLRDYFCGVSLSIF